MRNDFLHLPPRVPRPLHTVTHRRVITAPAKQRAQVFMPAHSVALVELDDIGTGAL